MYKILKELEEIGKNMGDEMWKQRQTGKKHKKKLKVKRGRSCSGWSDWSRSGWSDWSRSGDVTERTERSKMKEKESDNWREAYGMYKTKLKMH